jgi:T5SS/PEP-CTERM-associated repeat protein
VSLTGSGTVANSGTISASNTVGPISYDPTTHVLGILGAGLYLGGGGVSNAATGVISGILAVGLGGGGSIVNAGTVTDSVAGYGFGVALSAGGGVTNLTGGTISAGKYAVVSDGAASVSNQSGGRISGGVRGVFLIQGSGSVNNQGVINGTGFAGVELDHGGSVTNATGGSIAGEYYGVKVGGAVASVSNQGSIRSTGTANSAGVALLAGGTVQNLAGGGYIGGIYGVRIGGTVEAVINQGSINGSGGGGVLLTAGGTVQNLSGAVGKGTIGAAYDGVAITGGAGFVTNQGLIQNRVAFTTQTTVFGGVILAAGGSVNNSGTILAGSNGVRVDAADGTVSNSGLISSTRTVSGGAAVNLRDGGSVTNSGTILSGFFGVYVSGGSTGTVINSGTIFSSRASAGGGVALADGGSVTNSAGGLIAGKWIGVQFGPFGQTGAAPAGTFDNQGTVSAGDGIGDGAAVWVHGPGVIINRAGGVIQGSTAGKIVGGPLNGLVNGGFGIVAYYQTTVINYGSIGAGTYSSAAYHLNTTGPKQFAFDAASRNPTNTIANLIEMAPGASFGGVVKASYGTGSATLELLSGASIGTIKSFGKVTVSGIYYGGYLGFTAVKIDNGARWKLGGTVTSGTTVAFSGAGELILPSSTVVQGTVANFAQGDTLEIDGITVTGSSYAGGALTLTESSGTVAVKLPGTFSTGDFIVRNDAGNADISILQTQNRTLSWTGAVSTAFGVAANWNDISNGFGSAQTAPGATDTVEFNTSGGLVAGTGTVATVDVGSAGSGAMTVSGAQSSVTSTGAFTVGDVALGSLAINAGGTVNALAGAVIANTSGASGSSVNVSGAGSALHIAGPLIVGDGGQGLLNLSRGAVVTAASIDEAATAGGDGIISVVGTGSALTLTGSLTVGDKAAGELFVLNGAMVSALNVTIGNASPLSSGNVDVEGAGSTLRIGAGGVLNIGVAGGGSGVLTVGAGSTLNFAGTIVESGHASFNNNGGVIDPDAVEFTTTSNGGTGLNEYDLYVGNIGAVQVSAGTGTWLTPMVLTGTSVADAANNVNNNGDTGQWQLSQSGTFIINANTIDAGQAIVFQDATDTLVIGQVVNGGSAGVSGQVPTIAPGAMNLLQAGGFDAQIWGYQAGDNIEFNNMIVASDSIVGGNTLELFDSSDTLLGSLTFFNKAGNKPLALAGMQAAAAQIAPCFVEGTMIETASGPRRVESIVEGDELITLLGGSGPVVWVGSRRVDCSRHPKPETVWPVCIAAGAFGENVPMRDLFVSPNHAIYVDGVLVPARLLINGSTVRQVEVTRVAYHHVELRQHDVVLAEGLPAETYLDTGDRAKFEGGRVTRLFPDFSARIWEIEGCAPLVLTGPRLEKARCACAHARVNRAAFAITSLQTPVVA